MQFKGVQLISSFARNISKILEMSDTLLSRYTKILLTSTHNEQIEEEAQVRFAVQTMIDVSYSLH
jgi:hypothetical protein